ncbi:MAG: cadherin domain-containing protein, partial [Chloroflexi bacterium]|nr:cadherin domain-containing protein [Chloroflexota bacterium]
LEDSLTLYIDENQVDGGTPALALRTGEADVADDAPDAYVATDNDNTGGNTPDTITYSVEGPDRKHFGFADNTNGELSILTGEGLLGTTGANFESKSSYEITIVASSADAAPDTDPDRGTKYGRLNVTVMVVDREDTGKVTMSAREPQVGRSVHATLTDEDGGVIDVRWQWYRGDLVDGDDEDTLENECPAADAETTGTFNNGWQSISGARSPIYTADSATFDHDGDEGVNTAEVGYCLRATVTYRDDIDSDQDSVADGVQLDEMAHGVPDAPVQESDPANTAPKFQDDQDLNTPGEQADASRSVMENEDGAPVGDPVTAADGDDDLLMYSLSGDGADAFKTDNNGQISTAMKLDYETQNEYMVVLTATDPSGAYDMINVMITVMDADDAATITVGVVEPTHPCLVGGAVTAEQGAALAEDCQTLLDIVDELVGDGTAPNWSADTPMADWDGIASGTGRVAGIYLPDTGLAGVIPAGITALDALTRLTLWGNDLSGEIPDLSDLDNLERLRLERNSLSGSIPASLGDLDSIEYIWIHSNDLTGEIPAELSRATTLLQLRMNDNGLTGEIPSELGHLPNLRYLLLSRNELTGSIPIDLGSASNMKALYLYDNMLTGSIPAELGNMVDAGGASARLVYLHNNMLTGDVPAELGNLTDLRALRLSGNMLTGCIPAAIFGAAVDADAAGLAACP